MLLIPDGELIVSRLLRTHPAIVALRARVVPGVPNDTDGPWVQVAQVDATDRSRVPVEFLVDFMFQLSCYAGRRGDQAIASALARTVRAVLTAARGTVHDGVVIGRMAVTSDPRLPDTSWEPAMERRVVTALLMMHRQT